jgi:hypothetical protein
MKNALIKTWIWLCIVLPALFGVLMFANPQMVLEMNTPVGLVYGIGVRQLVFSAGLLVALRWLPRPTLALFIALRGATDLADGLASIAATGQLVGPVIFPILVGVLSLAVAYAIYRGAADRVSIARPAPAA